MSANPNTIPPYVFEQKGTSQAPFTFTVPATLEVRPDTATARFDGSGASGNFLACLTFYGTDGERLGRWFNPTVLTPGDVAEVTYTPPFGSAATNEPPAPSGVMVYALNFGIGANMPMNDAVQQYVSGTDYYLATDGGTYFSSAPGSINILQAGMYWVWASCYGAPTDAILGPIANGGSGESSSPVGGGAGDILGTYNTIIAGFMEVFGNVVGRQPEQQYAFGAFLASAADVAAGITFGPGLIVPTGWIDPAEHGANVIVWPAGGVPAGWT